MKRGSCKVFKNHIREQNALSQVSPGVTHNLLPQVSPGAAHNLLTQDSPSDHIFTIFENGSGHLMGFCAPHTRNIGQEASAKRGRAF